MDRSAKLAFMKKHIVNWPPSGGLRKKIETELNQYVLKNITDLISFDSFSNNFGLFHAIPNGSAAFILKFKTDNEWEGFKGSKLEDMYKLICKTAVYEIAIPQGASTDMEILCSSNSLESIEREIKRVGWRSYL